MPDPAIMCNRPRPGPMYWDWRCLNCDQPISAHDPWWRRVLRRIEDRLVLWTLEDWAKQRERKAHRAARKNGRSATRRPSGPRT